MHLTRALGRPWVAPRRAAIGLALAVTVACALGHSGAGAAIGAAVLATVATVPRVTASSGRLASAWAWLPVGAAAALAAGVVVAVLAGMAGVRLWLDAAAWAWIVFAGLFAGAGWARGGRIRLASPGALAVSSPAVLLAVAVVVKLRRDLSAWGRHIWDQTDWVNHGEFLVDVLRRGMLDYGAPVLFHGDPPQVSQYPRGLHAVLAWLISIGDPAPDRAGAWVAALSALMGVAAAAYVLAVLGSSVLAWFFAGRLGVGRAGSVVAGVVAGAAMIHLPWAANLLWFGFATTDGMTVLAFGLLIAVAGPAGRGRASGWWLAGALLVAAAAWNMWALMVLPVGVVVVVLAVRWRAAGWPSWPVVASSAAVAAVASAQVAVLTATANVGARQVAVDGSFLAFSGAMTVVVSVAALAVLVWVRRRACAGWVAWVGFIGSALALGVGLAVLVGPAPDGGLAYYPAKVLWHAVVVAWPVAVAGGAVVAARVWRSRALARMSGRRTAYRVAWVAAPVILVGAVAAGSVAAPVQMSAVALATEQGLSPQVPLLVADADVGPEGAPVLVWTLHPQGWHPVFRLVDRQASQVLRAFGYSTMDGAALTNHQWREACAWLRAHPDAVRLTGPKEGWRELLRRGCPASVVRPSAWTVLVSPAGWWAGTAWEASGGAPDPRMPSSDWILDAWEEQQGPPPA